MERRKALVATAGIMIILITLYVLSFGIDNPDIGVNAGDLMTHTLAWGGFYGIADNIYSWFIKS